MERHTIITLKQQGKSLREISRITGFSRKAVNRYPGKPLAPASPRHPVEALLEECLLQGRYRTGCRIAGIRRLLVCHHDLGGLPRSTVGRMLAFFIMAATLLPFDYL